ncbi:MAG: putative metallopeptidase [Candidatus Aenigmarchaeota archaeon]
MIRYEKDELLDARITEIANTLGMKHVDMGRVICIRSFGSKSRYILARCHTLPRIMQTAFKVKPHYLIEVVSEKFDRLSQEEQDKTLVHELMHIPKSFGGGFRHHRSYVNRRTVDRMYKEYLRRKNKEEYGRGTLLERLLPERIRGNRI